MSQVDSAIKSGNLLGKLPGMKDWNMYFVEMTSTHLHILDAHGQKQVRTLEIDSSDIAGEDTKIRKEFRFYLLRQLDGKYTFRCDTPSDRTAWISELQRLISDQQRFDALDSPTDMLSPDTLSPSHYRGPGFQLPPLSKKTALGMPLPAAPSPRASVISTDSGFGASEGGEVRRERGSKSAPNSGDGKFSRRVQSGKNGGPIGRPPVEVRDDTNEMDYEKCKWYWGNMPRKEAEEKLLAEGKKGNFIVRINANGYYVMTYWRKDGLHHHKILQHGNIYRFERSAVEAEGESLVDLLDTYMKANSSASKPMEPFGGALYEMYNYAWTPPAFNMDLLQERMKEQKRLREEARSSQRKNQYSPVDIGSSSSSREDSGSGSVSEARESGKSATLPAGKRTIVGKIQSEEPTKAGKKKPLPAPPTTRKTVGGAALIQEIKSKTMKADRKSAAKPSPRPKPTPPAKPGKLQAEPEFEPAQYANVGFGVSGETPPEPAADESLYMNITAPRPPPSRKHRTKQPDTSTSQYQNFGHKKKH